MIISRVCVHPSERFERALKNVSDEIRLNLDIGVTRLTGLPDTKANRKSDKIFKIPYQAYQKVFASLSAAKGNQTQQFQHNNHQIL